MNHRVFADTNILLDMMVDWRPRSQAARAIFERQVNGDVSLAICAGSLKDVYYITRRELPDVVRRKWIDMFLETFAVLPVDGDVCAAANRNDEPDFEDGIIRQCAEAWRADYILSRDEAAFRKAAVPRITCDELLAMLEKA